MVLTASLCSARTESSRSSSGVSSSLVWLSPPRLLTKSITVGMRRAISAASCRGPLGSLCDCPVTSVTASSAREIKSSSKGMGSMRHRRFHSTETSSSVAMRAVASSAASSMLASTPGSRARWSRDISHHPLKAVTMAGLTLTKPVVARTSSRFFASSRNATAERAAAMKASLLTSIGVTLDAEGAQHHPERQVHPFQNRALLDVELKVGHGVPELVSRLVDPVEVHAVLGEGVGQGHAVRVLEV